MKVELLINDVMIISFGSHGVEEEIFMETKKYSALDVAKYIVNDVNNSGKRITHLQIQKILYYIQAKFLIEENRALFEEPIEAWRHGPVIPKVYSYYKRYMSIGIVDTARPNVEFTERERRLIKHVINKYGSIDGWELVKQTHEENPWLSVYNNGVGRNREIPLVSIRTYFEGEKGKL